RMSIPPLAQSTLSMELPPGARAPQVLTALGSQQVTLLDTPKKGKSPAARLGAHLGRDGNLNVRWWLDRQPGQKTAMKVREAYLWDVRPAANQLSVVLQYTIGGAPVERLTVGLPAGLEVRGVESGLWKTPEGASIPRIRKWRVQSNGGRRQLQVEFQTPVSGAVQLTLEL